MALFELPSNEVIDEAIIGFVSLVFMETGDERKEEAECKTNECVKPSQIPQNKTRYERNERCRLRPYW